MPPERRLADHHFLGDLGMEAEIQSDSEATVRIPAAPGVLGADGGVRIGVLATLVDVVGGTAALRTVQPDWMATADLTVQLARPAVGPFVEARATVLRKGRTTLVVEAMVVDVETGEPGRFGGGGSPAGWASMTFAVLPGRTGDPMGNLGSGSEFPIRWALGEAGLDEPVAEVLGVRIDDRARGQVSLPVRDYLLNSFRAVQGGVMAFLAEVSATEMVAAARGSKTPTAATDLHVAYLALGRVGPIVSRSTLLEAGDEHSPGSVVVELTDSGADGRLTTVVDVGVGAGSSRAVALDPASTGS